MGLEACMTLGTLNEEQAQRLSAAGLDYYNHNLDTSPEFLQQHHHHPYLSGASGYADKVREAGIKVYSGAGLWALGETVKESRRSAAATANLLTRRKACQSTCW